jgi:hypothetical protein
MLLVRGHKILSACAETRPSRRFGLIQRRLLFEWPSAIQLQKQVAEEHSPLFLLGALERIRLAWTSPALLDCFITGQVVGNELAGQKPG